MNHVHPPVHYHPAHYAAPVAPPRLTPIPAPVEPVPREESDVRWIVGWIRDLLVIAMSLANLMHVNGGH